MPEIVWLVVICLLTVVVIRPHGGGVGIIGVREGQLLVIAAGRVSADSGRLRRGRNIRYEADWLTIIRLSRR